MAAFGDTELSATKMEIISEKVQRQLISESIVAPTILDVSAYAKKGADSISFPKGGNFTVENRASGALATQQVFNYTKDTMLLDHRATISWVVDPMDEVESAINVNADLITRAANGHAEYLEQQIVVEMEAVGVPTTTVGPISQTIILEMRADLLSRKAKRKQLNLLVGPDSEAIMLAIPGFVHADLYGSARIPSGAFGLIYGAPVYISTELGPNQYFMYDYEGIAKGFQKAPQIDDRKAPEYGAGARLFTMDQKFGVKGLHLGEQGVAPGLSALVAKDGN